MSEIRVLRNNFPAVIKPSEESAEDIRRRWRQQDVAAAAAKSAAQRREQNAWLVEELEQAHALGLAIVRVVKWHPENSTGFARELSVLNGEVVTGHSVYINKRRAVTPGAITKGTYLRVRIGSVMPGHTCPIADQIEVFTDSQT